MVGPVDVANRRTGLKPDLSGVRLDVARPTGRPVRDELVDAARDAIQRVGVSSVSFGHLADELGIKAPSVHHHFRRKEDLVAAVVSDYRSSFSGWAESIDDSSPLVRIRTYAARFAAAADDDQMCLCGAAAAEWVAVGEEPRAEVSGFFADQAAWLAGQLAAAVNAGEIDSSTDVDVTAATLLAALEGAVLMSRAGSPPALASDVVDVVVRTV